MKKTLFLFKALSDETRLRILNLLTGGEVCVCHLTEALQVGQSKVSRHLSYLKNAGWVEDRRDGLWVYYRLVPAKTHFHRKEMEALTLCFQENKSFRQDIKTLRRILKSNGLCE
ncbi:MAG: metalloregulator ArsR/SmtB family transcription factor [Nitrospirae bacterium]|nr:metalloregulator ArsR/SmtB family transcription factor [Nitrospirota bacterium]MBI3352724.1 metalloregulator ArsR/SmtB family transcription factor [Nitrospirota bacterium]